METAAGKTQEVENPEIETPQVPATSIPMFPTLKLVPFVQEKGKEILDFNTVFYDRATKRIIKRTERKVEAEGLPGKMIMVTAVMLGTDQDPRFTLRAGSAFIQASEENVGKIMMDLEQSKKYSAYLKDTLKKEREESNMLKRKYEYMQWEIRPQELKYRPSK